MLPRLPLVLGRLWSLALVFALLSDESVCRGQASTDDGDFVTVRDGRLSLRGERLRLWGTVGALPTTSRADNTRMVERLHALGFNSFRYWFFGGFRPNEFTPGDESQTDRHMHALAELKRAGFHWWFPALAGGWARPEDVALVDDPATAEAWAEAVRSSPRGRYDSHHGLAVVWDARLEAVAKRGIARVGQAVNPYTGIKLADDPASAVTELTNEQWWFRKMIGGQWQSIPVFFQQSLLARWHDYLVRKHGDDAGLRAAWGFLLPGESLAERSVLLAPMKGEAATVFLNDANPRAIASVQGVKQHYGPEDFTAARAADVIGFFLEIWVAHKQRLHDHVKAQGRAWALAPTIWDTGIGYEMQSAYLQQHGDATSHCSYISGFSHDPQHKRFPWRSGLDEPPRLSWRDPWLEQNRHPTKPMLSYETNMATPAKYRAEYPLRLAALALLQDWDAVTWHTFASPPVDLSKPEAFDEMLDHMHSDWHAERGYILTYDEVQNASLLAASALFRGGAIPPAPQPTTFVFGRRSLHRLDRIEYGSPSRRFAPTTWRYGMRLLIDPTREDDAIVGPSYEPATLYPNPLSPAEGLTVDWHQAYQTMDSPGAASYVGFLADYRAGPEVRFARNDTVFRDVVFNNPPDMPYPVKDDERFAALTLVAADGKTFAASERILLVAVSTSMNTGFKLDESKLRKEFLWPSNPGAIFSDGTKPVLVTRVGVTVRNPALAGRRYAVRDWRQQIIASGVVGADGEYRLAPETPAFCVEFTSAP